MKDSIFRYIHIHYSLLVLVFENAVSRHIEFPTKLFISLNKISSQRSKQKMRLKRFLT